MARLLLFSLILVTFSALASMPAFAQSAPKPNFNGSYALAGNQANRVFSLDVAIKGHRATISFSASMADGSGAAPDADGAGKIEDGALSFKFKDSFNNEGTAKLQLLPASGLYQLDMVVTKVVESSPLHFYGTLQLKKVADQPMPR